MIDLARGGDPTSRSGATAALVSLVFLLPALHPALIPVVGVASHLLWFTHALPVAWWSRRLGGPGAILALLASFVSVLLGERTFGAGYGAPAPWDMAWALAVASAFSNALVASFAVLTRRTLLEYQALFDGAPVGVLRLSADGRVRLANARAAEILGVPTPDLRDQRLDHLLPAWTAPAPDSTPDGRLVNAVQHLVTSSRDRRLDVVQTRLPDSDVQILVLDVTQEHALQAQLEQAQKMELVGRFAGSIAHDFGNLLLSISASLELALDSVERGEDVVPDLQDAQRGVESARALTRQLLTFGRRSGTETVRVFDANTTVEVTSTLVRRLLRDQVSLSVSMSATPLHVQADPVQLQQVLLNLLVNAQDALPATGGRIAVDAGCVDGERPALEGAMVVGEDRTVATGWIHLRVSDSGTGIESALMGRIFEPFFTTKAEEKGTGLGLSTVATLADRMGAELRVRSTLGVGTVFDVFLPPAPSVDAVTTA